MRHGTASGRLALAALFLVLAGPARAGDLAFGVVARPGPAEKPALLVTPPRALSRITVVVQAGGEEYEFTRTNVAAGKQIRFEWPRDPSTTTATAWVTAEFADMSTEEVSLPLQWDYGGGLKVDLSGAFADVSDRTLTVTVTERVDSADIKSYGAHKAVLDERSAQIGAGPGAIQVPWIGDPGEVVLLDVTVRNARGWAGFTYSPWFLDIPHNDVLFDTDQAVVRPEEEFKLQETLAQLATVIDKYGSVVPVKLYIAGCTDTVGDTAHNRDLSQRRAKAIATWLRGHGYGQPIYYYGFGEGLPAVDTLDGVDEPRNRRALYIVGANPPPRGSGIPSVSWVEL